MINTTYSVNGEALPNGRRTSKAIPDRRHFIGGSDARIIMGKDEKALLRLWREKRGDEPPLDLSGVLLAQLGLVTEDLNRRWYEAQLWQSGLGYPAPCDAPNNPVDGRYA